ncbi:ATP-binding protein [Mycolicibacterium monacense]|uniref:ATP-binding protein n=1 Tax=Mycolicibacterium monacense TaxID=85693 RepID=UPI0010424564|nr:ATP-binding protein [Mycolicibacterium monacense]
MSTALRVGGAGPARRHLSRRVGLVCLLVRHTTSLVVAVLAAVADGDVAAHPSGRLLLILLGLWSVYRLATRSQLWQFTAADFCWIVAVGCSVGMIAGGAAAFETHNAAETIVGVALATFVIEIRPGLATPMTVVIVSAYGWGTAQVVGWDDVGRVADLYYLVAGWVATTVIRMMSWRIAGAVDRAHDERQAAEIARSVSAARRNYDREQLALLHDTAAATLLMVGQGAQVADERLAAQARRDLELLENPPWTSPALTVDIVEVLRRETAFLRTAVQFTGRQQLWLRGDLAGAIVSAAREVTNNVDRHADAKTIRIDVADDRVTIADDGIGFTPGAGLSGHGIRASIVGRMNRVGGSGSIRSAPAQGTVAELSWPAHRPIAASVDAATGADRLIGRLRAAYTLALTAYAIIGLATAAPPIAAYERHGDAQLGLIALAGLCALTSVPAVFYRERRPAWVAAGVLAVIAFLQPALLTTRELTTHANWALAAVGFCLLPLLLRWDTRRAAGTLLAYWCGPAIIAFVRDPGKPMLVFLGLSLAGALIPQMFATLFISWAARAARDARAEHDNLLQVVTAEKVAAALQADHLKRYADIMAGVIPLLRALSRGEPVTSEMRRRARAESRRLRTLFDRLRADHPLLFEIRSLIEAAEDRGVEVTVHFDGDLPPYDPADVDRIVRRFEQVIALATVSARVVVTAAADEVTVSVVCEVAPGDAGRDIDVDGAELMWSGQTAWLTIRQRVDAGAQN